MDKKLNYISRLFQRTSKKRIEHYVISRIWHLLDDYDIKMTPQQYVSREKLKYALTDVYFPQFGIHVEVNEPAHYSSEENIYRDRLRQSQIEMNTGHKVYVINCNDSIEGIHKQIDRLVFDINKAAVELKEQGEFKPWHPEREHNPYYWKQKGIISTKDEISLHTIEDICLLFGADPKKTKRGFLRKGGIKHPEFPEILLWWPSERPRSGWQNNFNAITKTITETHTDIKKKINHYRKHSKEKHTRVVFFHYKDILGMTNYKYVGVYSNDREKSNENTGTIWTRIGERINLQTGQISNE